MYCQGYADLPNVWEQCWPIPIIIITSIKIIKNEVGCRDDTVPKIGDTRSHCEVELTACNNLPQPPKNEM